MRVVVNLVIMVLELAAIAGVAWLGLHHPYLLAVLAAVLAFVLGLSLERARLKIELGFYLGRPPGSLTMLASLVAFAEAFVKALLAGVVTLITFSGTDQQRLVVVAVVFGCCLFAGTSLLRRLSISFGVVPSRWGYFRLAAPLGLLFSAAIYLATVLKLLPKATLTEVAGKLVLDTPSVLSLERASELLFILKQKFDDIIVTVLQQILSPELAQIAGILVSVNMLTGFAIGVFAVAIADVVQRLETTE
ncbi:MAG: hypothetical protein AB7O43_17565 [Hyphomicrobiaceae bacterium]